MFESIINFFKNLFGGRTKEQRAYSLAYSASMLISANNPDYVSIAKTSFGYINDAIVNNKSAEVINSLFMLAIDGLKAKVNSPAERAAIVLFMSEFNGIGNSDDLVFDIPIVTSIVKGFIDGLPT